MFFEIRIFLGQAAASARLVVIIRSKSRVINTVTRIASDKHTNYTIAIRYNTLSLVLHTSKQINSFVSVTILHKINNLLLLQANLYQYY